MLAGAFDDLRRSTATLRLAEMIALGVVSDEELGQFSEQTREWMRNEAEMRRRREERSLRRLPSSR